MDLYCSKSTTPKTCVWDNCSPKMCSHKHWALVIVPELHSRCPACLMDFLPLDLGYQCHVLLKQQLDHKLQTSWISQTTWNPALIHAPLCSKFDQMLPDFYPTPWAMSSSRIFFHVFREHLLNVHDTSLNRKMWVTRLCVWTKCFYSSPHNQNSYAEALAP